MCLEATVASGGGRWSGSSRFRRSSSFLVVTVYVFVLPSRRRKQFICPRDRDRRPHVDPLQIIASEELDSAAGGGKPLI